jgi:hypothetical protein
MSKAKYLAAQESDSKRGRKLVLECCSNYSKSECKQQDTQSHLGFYFSCILDENIQHRVLGEREPGSSWWS